MEKELDRQIEVGGSGSRGRLGWFSMNSAPKGLESKVPNSIKFGTKTLKASKRAGSIRAIWQSGHTW